MPVPHPSQETQDEWMSRCIPQVMDEGTAEDQDQAVAICSSMWDDAEKGMKVNRAYSLLTIKAVDEDRRILSGMATTPSTDRMGDIVEPKGASFTLPIPFLWQHNSAQPIGHVTKAKVSKDGIEVEVHLAKISEPGPLKTRIDEAWQSIKAGLVRGLSIGFKALEFAHLDDGGLRFLKWSWLELSAVTIAANQDATITTIKSLDDAQLAATGRKSGAVRITPPGASGISKPKRQENNVAKTYQERIKDAQSTLATKSARMEELMAKADEAGTTLDQAQAEEYETLKGECASLDDHITRLVETEKFSRSKAKQVNGDDQEAASNARSHARVEVIQPKLEKGIGFARYVMCKSAAKGDLTVAAALAKRYYPEYIPLQNIMKMALENGGIRLDMTRKTAVPGGTTSDANHHSALVNYQDLVNEFVEFLRPQTIIGQFGTGNIPSLRRVPFNIRVPRQTTKASGYWTGEGKPKLVTSFNTEQITLDFFKAATICVLTDELVRFSSPSAEALVRDELARAVAERIDIDFIDPSNSGSANVKPASITNGAVSIASSGDAASNVRTDIQALFAEFIQANMGLAGAVFIMNQNVALGLSMIMSDLSTPEFPGVTMNGGNLVGIPVLTSQYVPTAVVVLAAANEIYLADDGNVTVDMSREASIEMVDASSQDAGSGTGASLVSMFQTNSVAIRAEREINWRLRRAEAVAYLTSANWGGTAGSADI